MITFLFPGSVTDLFAGTTGKEPVFSQNYQVLQYEESSSHFWQITYQYPYESTFTGTIRHTAVINSLPFPMLSHDILVTTGDFADRTVVSTSVTNHHFRWASLTSEKPEGTINLLHIVPATAEIEIILNRLRKWDQVSITGVEIDRISKMVDQSEATYWTDAGCNTILVTAVSIISP